MLPPYDREVSSTGDKLVSRYLTVRLDEALNKIHLSKRKVSQPPSAALIRVPSNIVVCRKNILVLFLNCHGERLELDPQYVDPKLLHHGLEAVANINAEEFLVDFKPGGGNLKDKATKPPSSDVIDTLKGLSCECLIGPTSSICHHWSISGPESIMLPGEWRLLNTSVLIPNKAVLGSMCCSLDE